MYHPLRPAESWTGGERRCAMVETGFFEQRRGSPTGLAMVVLLHAAVFAALILVKGPDIVRQAFTHTVITTIPVPPDPAVDPPPPVHRPVQQQQQSVIDRIDPMGDTHPTGPAGHQGGQQLTTTAPAR